MCHQVYAHLPTASVGSLIKTECWIQKQTAEWLSGTIFSSITSPQWMNVKFVQESSWSISHCMFTGTAFHLYVLHFFFVAWYSQACKESLDLGWLKGSMNSNLLTNSKQRGAMLGTYRWWEDLPWILWDQRKIVKLQWTSQLENIKNTTF